MKLERFSSNEFPYWIPNKVQKPLKEAKQKAPIDLVSEYKREKYLVNNQELADLTDFLNQFEKPIFVGMNGSRAAQSREPLFTSVSDFDAYYRTDKKYLYPQDDIMLARNYLNKTSFNDDYIDGKKMPARLVNVLVRDIDLLIFDEKTELPSGSYHGKRSNVPLDVTICTTSTMFDVGPDDFLYSSLEHAVPVKIK